MPANDHIMQGGIYQIRCLVNDKVYIGSAVNFRMRWKNHRVGLLGGSHHNWHLQNAWQKYGVGQFVFEILQVIENKEDLIRIEQEWLDRIRPFDRTIGYNASPTAGSTLGLTPSPETRARLSAAGKGRKHTPEARAKMSVASKGRITTAETRIKIGLAGKGRKHTPEARAKISAAGKVNFTAEMRAKLIAANTGRSLSADSRAKMSASQKGKIISSEQRAKISEANRRRPCVSPETRAKMSASLKFVNRGRKHTDKSRANMSAAAKRRWSAKKRSQRIDLANHQTTFCFLD